MSFDSFFVTKVIMYLQHHNLRHLSFLTVFCLLSSIFVYSETKYKYSKLKQSLNTTGVQIYVPYHIFRQPNFSTIAISWAIGEKYIHNLFAKIRSKSYEVSILQGQVSYHFFYIQHIWKLDKIWNELCCLFSFCLNINKSYMLPFL